MKTKLFVICVLTSLYLGLNATPQVRDIVFWNGIEYHSIPRIAIHENFSEQEMMYLNSLCGEHNETNNYRGYRFEFEIDDDSLYLIAIKNNDNKNITGSILGSLERRKMCHYSDTMYLGYGEMFYDNAWWTMVYESEKTVVFQNGVVQGVKDNKNKSKYSQYDHNDLLFSEFVYCNTRWNELDEQTLQKKPVVHLRYDIDTLGRIAEIKILKSSGYTEFDEEAIRVIKSIPGFSVSFVKGEYIPHSYDYSFIFDIERAKKMARFSKQKQYDNQLLRLFEESILIAKTKYYGLCEKTSRKNPLFLCSDGLPNPILEQNKPFYENIGLDIISLNKLNIHQIELERGIDLMEIHYYLKGNFVEIYIHILTVTEENNEVLLSSPSHVIDKYVFEYSCETNEWRLKE